MLENALGLEEIFTITNMLIYAIIINGIGFLAMWLDKRKAQKGSWRTPEKTLFLIAILGGSIGTTAGMYVFRHKTQKGKFTIGFPIIIIMQIIAIIYFLIK